MSDNETQLIHTNEKILTSENTEHVVCVENNIAIETKTNADISLQYSISQDVRYKKEEDYKNPPFKNDSPRELPNGFQEQLKEALQNNQVELETVSSKHGPIQMITLGSNNNLFMQSRTSDIHPIYTAKQLPQYLQDSLTEAFSSMSITDDDQKEKSVEFIDYKDETHLPDLTELITKDLSEPYSVYTYRYFLHNWPSLSFLAYCEEECVGAIVCKLDQHRKNIWRGYIAMLVVHKDYRRHKIGSKLVQKAIRRMVEQGCDEVVLETEVTNRAALHLYENLGFIRDKRLLRYYLNGVDAWRLKLWLV